MDGPVTGPESIKHWGVGGQLGGQGVQMLGSPPTPPPPPQVKVNWKKAFYLKQNILDLSWGESMNSSQLP